MLDRETWERDRVVASMWWCGDYTCDCTRPVIERISPNREIGYPAVRIELLWEGTFCSNDTEQNPRKQWRELREAADRFGAERRWKPGDEAE